MGYYTDYTLEVINDANHDLVQDKLTTEEDVIEWMKKAGAAGDISDYGESYNELCGTMNAKWYDFDQDMRKVSLAFPHLLIKLAGHGDDESHEWWRYYYMGKCHDCTPTVTVVYPQFDPAMLK